MMGRRRNGEGRGNRTLDCAVEDITKLETKFQCVYNEYRI